jgi:hypothetical protein
VVPDGAEACSREGAWRPCGRHVDEAVARGVFPVALVVHGSRVRSGPLRAFAGRGIPAPACFMDAAGVVVGRLGGPPPLIP